jgi:glucose-1-phosphate cytidylyltransferase
MKVVLFCGGQGMRIREYSDEIPKPMVPIGYRPILWHVMKYYAYHGHKDFILCLGYKADVIKNFFLDYDECVSNDFTLSGGGRSGVQLQNSDIHDWRITFVDTGMSTNIGGRLLAVREHLKGEDVFLANYADNLTNASLPDMIDFFYRQDAVASFLCVRPSHTFHLVRLNGSGVVDDIENVAQSNVIINGGHFVLSQQIFDYMEPGDELVEEPFVRLIKEKRLAGYEHKGFFVCMDTFKERQVLDEMFRNDRAPWSVWDPRKMRNLR